MGDYLVDNYGNEKSVGFTPYDKSQGFSPTPANDMRMNYDLICKHCGHPIMYSGTENAYLHYKLVRNGDEFWCKDCSAFYPCDCSNPERIEPQNPNQTVPGLGRPYTTDSAEMVKES